MSPRRFFHVLALSALTFAVTARGHDFRMNASVTFAENISRTSFEPTARNATVWSVDSAFIHAKQLAPNWTLIAAAEANVEHVAQFSALNKISVGARATIRHKFGLGPMVPVLEFGGDLSRGQFHEHGRRGWRTEGFANLSQRLTESWRVVATASQESFSAEHAPFDTHLRRLGLETYYDLTETWQIGAGFTRIDGQLVANAAWSVWSQAITGGFGPAIQSYYTSVPWAVTDTFGAGWVAYRVDCRADLPWVQLLAKIDERTSATLRYETAKVINHVGVRYDSTFWSLGLLRRF